MTMTIVQIEEKKLNQKKKIINQIVEKLCAIYLSCIRSSNNLSVGWNHPFSLSSLWKFNIRTYTVGMYNYRLTQKPNEPKMVNFN